MVTPRKDNVPLSSRSVQQAVKKRSRHHLGPLPAPQVSPGAGATITLAPGEDSGVQRATGGGSSRAGPGRNWPPEPSPHGDAGLPRGEGLLTHLIGNFKSPQQGHDFLLEVLLLQDKQDGIRALGAASRRTRWGRHGAAPRGRPQQAGGAAQTRGNTCELGHGCWHFNNSKRFHKHLKPQLWADLEMDPERSCQSCRAGDGEPQGGCVHGCSRSLCASEAPALPPRDLGRGQGASEPEPICSWCCPGHWPPTEATQKEAHAPSTEVGPRVLDLRLKQVLSQQRAGLHTRYTGISPQSPSMAGGAVVSGAGLGHQHRGLPGLPSSRPGLGPQGRVAWHCALAQELWHQGWTFHDGQRWWEGGWSHTGRVWAKRQGASPRLCSESGLARCPLGCRPQPPSQGKAVAWGLPTFTLYLGKRLGL